MACGLIGAAVAWKLQRGDGRQLTGEAAVESPAVDSPVRDLSLPEAERSFLWDLEHHVNLLNKVGFKALGQALAAEDAEALTDLLAQDFEGAIFSEDLSLEAGDETYSVQRRQRAGNSDRALTREEFVSWLLELRRTFQSPPKFEFGISSLSPEDRTNLDGAWLATCRMRAWGHDRPDKPVEVHAILKVRTDRPTRERLAQPGWMRGCAIEQFAAAKARHSLFREVAAERGLSPDRWHDNWLEEDKVGQTGGLYACDYNRDGCPDLLVTDLESPGVALFRGSPEGDFVDVTEETGLLASDGRLAPGFTGLGDSCVFADLDNDGWEDLIVLAGGLLRNRGGRAFEDMSERTNLFSLIYSPDAPPKAPATILPADYDRDGLIDLYVVRSGRLRDADVGWIDEEPLADTGNQLLHNLGKGRFEDVTRSAGANGGGRSVFTAAWLDADNDAWPDVYVISEFGKGVLLVNQRDGTFQERFLAEGIADFGSMGLAVGDIDNDGWIDIYSANMYSKAGNRVIGNLPPGVYDDEVLAKFRRLVSGSRLYRNRGRLSFEETGRRFQVHDAGWAWGASLADLNNDGWLDLYATAGYMSRDRGKPDG